MKTNSRKRSMLLAGCIALAVFAWMLSGTFINPSANVELSSALSRSEETAGQTVSVRVRQMNASEHVREIIVSARTEPNRSVTLRAETNGIITAINVERGEAVSAGETILQLDMRDRNARLARAEALLAQRETELQALQDLRSRQFTTDIQIAEARALLEVARADLESILLEINRTSITAPFDGVIQERQIEIGDYVRDGDPVIELVDMDPLIISGEVNEREVNELARNGYGSAVLEDGTELDGTIRYISPVADDNTRTFTLELAVPNPDGRIRAGLSAGLTLYASAIRAHTISSALLSLADDGTIGVKAVNDSNRVEFFPVEIISSTDRGINVIGLPDKVRLITVGQGFVVDGQLVNPVPDSMIRNNPVNERVN